MGRAPRMGLASWMGLASRMGLASWMGLAPSRCLGLAAPRMGLARWMGLAARMASLVALTRRLMALLPPGFHSQKAERERRAPAGTAPAGAFFLARSEPVGPTARP